MTELFFAVAVFTFCWALASWLIDTIRKPTPPRIEPPPIPKDDR